MNKNKRFDKFTLKELAESFVFPSMETKKEKDQDAAAVAELRKQLLGELPPKKKLLFKVLQLRYRIEEYLASPEYQNNMSFGYFLKEYVRSLDKKMKEFAEDVNVKPTELSQLVNRHRKPKEEFLVRLGIHSNHNIPALIWYKLVEKENEHELINNRSLWRTERKHVRNKLSIQL